MSSFTDEDFNKFLESFNEVTYEDENHKSHKCHDSLTELSKSDSEPYNSLITHPFEMYGLDWMVKSADKWKDTSSRCQKNFKACRHKFPKSTDALFFKLNPNNPELHIILFKFIPEQTNMAKLENLYNQIIEKNNKYTSNQSDDFYHQPTQRCFDKEFVKDFESIKENYIDDIEYSLQLKPYEAIFIALPGLYDEYCKKENEPKKDIKGFLANIDKYYWVCIDSGITNSEEHLHSQAKGFEKYYKRLEPDVFKQVCVKTKNEFKVNLEEDILSGI